MLKLYALFADVILLLTFQPRLASRPAPSRRNGRNDADHCAS